MNAELLNLFSGVRGRIFLRSPHSRSCISAAPRGRKRPTTPSRGRALPTRRGENIG
jgi:hypothetical protein